LDGGPTRQHKIDTHRFSENRLRILCIDDDPAVLVLLQDVLANCGHEAFATSSVSRGLLAIERSDVDVVILDYEMKELTGADAAHLFRKVSPNIPIVMFSGHCQSGHRDIASNSNLWVEKPDLRKLLTYLDDRQRQNGKRENKLSACPTS
jgi:CheY-like chemotaxis protein